MLRLTAAAKANRYGLDRSGPSTLVEVGNQKLLFDAGRGATVRLRQLKVALA
jgi:ribonuclease BN (tRNA processing enzyme)